MDPFTQRMLERARARQEKIDQKLANTGQTVPKRKPLTENIGIIKNESPVKSPSRTSKDTVTSSRRSSLKPDSPAKSVSRTSMKQSDTPVKTVTRRSSTQKELNIVASPQKTRNDVIVTKKEFKSSRGSSERRNSDVSLEINIMHSKDIQIDVQIEERDAPMTVTYGTNDAGSNVIIEEIEVSETSTKMLPEAPVDTENRAERAGLRTNIKSRLDRLGNLYSDKPTLSSPIHRTEQNFSAATPPKHNVTPVVKQANPDGKKKFGRFAALADQINNWEDDLSHHNFHPEPTKKPLKPVSRFEKDASTLDVSIHSISDINKVLQTNVKATQPKQYNVHTFTKPNTNECQRLQKQIVAELEGEGFRRVSASKSRLVYDFTATENADHARQEPTRAPTTPSEEPAPDMATMVASAPPIPITKKPSIKKYKAPTPPQRVSNDDDKDSENNVLQHDANDNDASDCKQTKLEPAEKPVLEKGSPIVKKLAPKLNGNVDRSSVLSKAAMFEAGSPRAKDPAEMSLRERKALFEKNKGVAIVPKAPFGMAPSVRTLHGDNKADTRTPKQPASVKTTPTKSNNSSASNSRTNSKDNLDDDNVSQSSIGGGIRGKLAALFSKEQTISETTIANKFKLEREKEMEMLQNRFHYKSNNEKPDRNNESDDDQSDHDDPSEKAPLMGSALNLAVPNKKPEIIANVPKVTFDDKKHEPTDKEAEKVTSQPIKRRSSQTNDSPIVLSVLEDVKRIKVNNNKKEAQANGVITSQPSLYPHLSDIETDTSHTQDEYSDCGGSSVDEKEHCTKKDNLNKSDNWAETSFGREIMNVVKKNNSSYQKAVRESMTDSSEGNCDSELDDMLDEALNDEGPTPPKVNKQGSLSSNSFVYQEKAQFKSPQKQPLGTPRPDKGNELVHSVSFYRRMQSASSTPTTPMRIVRHVSPEREIPPTPTEPAASVTTVRQRIKELQQEVSKQQTVISQASQALNLCAATIEFSGSTEQAEGERLLLLATHRRQACLHEMQRLQVEGAGPAAKAGMASLHINSITVPLRRDYIRHLNADGATGHHAVCLLKCRDRVLASSMQLTQPTASSLHFPDEIRMDGLASDFKVTVEVYLLPASKEILPHDVKYHINSKKSSSKLLTPKSKVSELKTPRTQSPGGPLAARSPQFQPHGYCIFALPQATRRSFTLNKLPVGSPLEGSVSLDMAARVAVPAPAAHAAFLTAFDDVSGLGAWHRRWSRLQPPLLSFWKYPDDVHKKPPICDIDLTTVISEKVIKAPRDLCARPNTLLLECEAPCGLEAPESSLVCFKRPDGTLVRRHLLAADTPEHRDKWLQCLNSALEYYRCTPADDR